jgi:hypothetical protein
MQPTQVNTPTNGAVQNNKSFDQQLADIKSQARTIVTQAQKISPDIKIKPVDAEMLGIKPNIPTTKQTTPRPSALDTVGTTPLPQTGLDKAREAILGSVKNQEDRDIIDQILQVSTGLQTERGTQLEGTADSLMTQQLSNIQSTRDRALDTSSQKEAMKLPELEAELESIRSENDVLTARKNAAIQAAEREQGMSTMAKSGNIQRISRDFDLEQANLAIRELASVGKINASTKLIQAKMDLKYGDLEAEANLLNAQINAIKPFLDREDAKAADMRLQLNEVVKGKLADARAEDTALEEFKLQSYINAQQNGASPAVLSSIMSSDNRQDVASVGGGFIQSPMEKLQMENLRGQIATDTLRRQQIQTEINSTNNPVDVSTVIQNAVTDSNPITVKESLASLLGSGSISPSTKARISPSLAVLNSVDELANGNIEGKFTGIGVAGRIKEGIKGLFGYKDSEAITNAQNIEAINLKVQQWASGAALTDAQTKQVARFTPTLNDRDTTVKSKLNGLYNFMLNQAESDLLTEGINVQFPAVNLFEISDLYSKASPEQKAIIEQTYFNK